ncbi:IS3 family transposase [Paenibacillus motobuensis]|uniref:IS3 family transposase n=1 Tax=Paenibacillus motobuensis TaxID=295324 RepID=UPI003632DDC7
MHYTHPKFQKRVKEVGFQQSMCYDNASMESFFGHMKDELTYKDCQSIEELRIRINEYIYFYNTERYQWTLNVFLGFVMCCSCLELEPVFLEKNRKCLESQIMHRTTRSVPEKDSSCFFQLDIFLFRCLRMEAGISQLFVELIKRHSSLVEEVPFALV